MKLCGTGKLSSFKLFLIILVKLQKEEVSVHLISMNGFHIKVDNERFVV